MGLAENYDFVYLPFDFAHGSNMGCGFLNFVTQIGLDVFLEQPSGEHARRVPNAPIPHVCCFPCFLVAFVSLPNISELGKTSTTISKNPSTDTIQNHTHCNFGHAVFWKLFFDTRA